MHLGEFGVAVRAAEEQVEPDTFGFCGERFRIADQVGILPLGKFADAITSGAATLEDEVAALAAIYQLLRDCLHDDDWQRFERTASRNRAGVDDLLPIARGVWGVVTGRPTKRPSVSSDGPSTTGQASKPGSSSPGTDLPWSPPPNRPDLQAQDMTSVDALLGR